MKLSYLKSGVIAVSLSLALGTALNAHAGSGSHKKVYLKNCYANEKVRVCAFNGKDSVTAVEHSTDTIGYGEGTKLKCHGQGKGGCKVRTDSNESNPCGARSGKLFDGRHKGYFRIMGESDGDLEEITETQYNSADVCK